MSNKKTAKDIFRAVNNLISAYKNPKPGKDWLGTEDLCRILKTDAKSAKYMRKKLVNGKLATAKTFILPSGRANCRHTFIKLGKEAKKAFGLP